VPIHIPPLRDRVDDIMLLAEHFLALGLRNESGTKKFSAAAMEALMSFEWPGNVRELKNLISRTLLNIDKAEIDAADFNFAPKTLKESTHFENRGGGQGGKAPKTLRELEKDKILQELVRNNWNKKKTAEILGIAKTTLFEKIKKYQLKPE
jgi:DNA-binding NtrC family response regulator